MTNERDERPSVPVPPLRSLSSSELLETVRVEVNDQRIEGSPDANGSGAGAIQGACAFAGTPTHHALADASISTPPGATPDLRSNHGIASNLLPENRYEVRERLGKGGGGDVFGVHDGFLDRHVALKVLRDGALGSDAARRFINEARLTARLDHPNTLPVYDLGRDRQGRWFFSMRKALGQTLAQLIDRAREGNMPSSIKSYADRVEVMVRVCDAIAYAHSRGVVHRDIKPSNIVLGEYGEVVVIDWGTAFDLAQGQPDQGLVVGTPAFMSPEQASGGPVDERSDIYCLGGTLWMLLTLQRPAFVGGSDEEFWLRKMRGDLPEPPAGIPHELLEVARKALASCPSDRYPTAAEFRDALREWQRHQASVAFCDRGRRALLDAQARAEYAAFSRAADYYRNALEEWPDNPYAKRGVAEVLAAHARLALARGDIALASGLLQEDEPLHAELRQEAQKAREEQLATRRRIGRLRLLALLGLLALLITAGGLWRQRYLSVGAWQTMCDLTGRALMERLRPAAEGTIVASHIEAGGLLLPRGQLFWVDGVDASGNVEVEAEVEWLRDVDGFEIVARSRSELSHRVEVPAGYSCQFGGYQGTTSYISQNRKAGAPTTDSAIWIPFKLHRRYRLTFVVENGEAALLVDGVDRLRLRSLLPLGDHSYRKVGIRIWTDVIVHRLTVRRQQLPQKPSPLLAGDALVAAGHYRDAVQRYQEVASDFPRSKIAELALARGYLTALLDEGAEHDAEALLERLLQEYPASPHRQRCEEAAVAASWRAGRRQEALARAQRVLARYPDSRVAVPLMTPSGQRLERDAARPLLELLSRTLQLSRINLTGMDIEDLSPLKGREFVHLLLPHTAVKDLSPLRGMQLKLLDIAHTSIDSLEPLRGMPLESLSIEGTLVKDLGPLRGMPLVSLTVTGSRVTDLTPLSKMRLTSFLAGFQQLESLEPLRDMPLRRVHLQRTGVASLEPLSAAPLTDLYASGNRITDIGVLAGKPLSSLALARNRIKDISPLSGISGNYLDLSHNEIRDLSPLAGSRWHELSVGSNPVKDISPLAGTAARLFIADLPPQRVAALTQENLSFLEFNGTKILDPDELRGFSALAQLRLVGSVAPEILDELALAYEKRKRARALVRNLRVQAAYARRDVAALRALAGSMGGISALMLPFETDLDTARRVAQELGGRLPMLRDAIERELVEAELSPSEDVWLDAAFRDGSIRWADQTPIGEPPLPFDRAVVARQGGGLSWLRVGQHCTWGAIPKDHPEWQAAPLVIWRADGAARAEMGGASTSER